LISVVLGTCIAVFAAAVALAFWPAAHPSIAPTVDSLKEVDYEKLTPEERRRWFDN
jgi:hypothetical protein